ncbi:MAG: DUF3459 domain-containing protein [Thermorudis peleae]|nr:DUF3459 domain-containing protein [Thermorudis peleae]
MHGVEVERTAGKHEAARQGGRSIDVVAGQTRPWWQGAVIYQIYPRSFQDTNSDGIGDLRGILQRLDYLAWLGVDAIWISPFFPSPMADFGYDISNYTDVDPRFGTLQDFDELIAAAQARGLRVILDLVPNHTSDQHPWFQAARSSRTHPQRDWYIWCDPAPDGGPPNNWLSVFGGSAWEWDEATGQYYLHTFLREQPDLNWRNPAVRQAMYDVIRFWLDRGVAGFRLDAIWFLMKDPLLRDNPPNPYYRPDAEYPHQQLLPVYTSDLPAIHPILAELRAVVDQYDARVLIGEIYLPPGRLVDYFGCPHAPELHLPYNFALLQLPWDPREIAAAVDTYEALVPDHGWPSWVLGNHDRPRLASRVGVEQARVAAMLLLTLRGTSTIYYGEEIGMVDVAIPAERLQDPIAFTLGRQFSRDPARTPMQWDATPHAGFTTGEPWLPVAPDYRERNVAQQRADQRSLLSLYRRLLELRRAEPALVIGEYVPLTVTEQVLAYRRSLNNRHFAIVLNFSGVQQTVQFRFPLQGSVVLSTELDREGDAMRAGKCFLRPHEGVVVQLTSLS